jgi:hypothetical protein
MKSCSNLYVALYRQIRWFWFDQSTGNVWIRVLGHEKEGRKEIAYSGDENIEMEV